MQNLRFLKAKMKRLSASQILTDSPVIGAIAYPKLNKNHDNYPTWDLAQYCDLLHLVTNPDALRQLT